MKREDLAPFTFGANDWPTIVFVNGVFAPALSSLEASCPTGVKRLRPGDGVRDEPIRSSSVTSRKLATTSSRVHGAQQRVHAATALSCASRRSSRSSGRFTSLFVSDAIAAKAHDASAQPHRRRAATRRRR